MCFPITLTELKNIVRYTKCKLLKKLLGCIDSEQVNTWLIQQVEADKSKFNVVATL